MELQNKCKLEVAIQVLAKCILKILRLGNAINARKIVLHVLVM